MLHMVICQIQCPIHSFYTLHNMYVYIYIYSIYSFWSRYHMESSILLQFCWCLESPYHIPSVSDIYIYTYRELVR